MRPKTLEERQRAIAMAQEADKSAARRKQFDRLERASRIRSESPATHPEAFNQVVLQVHREQLDAELAAFMRMAKRIIMVRTAARLDGDEEAYRLLDEEAVLIAAIIKQYTDLKGGAGASTSGSVAALRRIQEMRR